MVGGDIHTQLHTHGGLSIVRGLFSAPCMGILGLQLSPSRLAPFIAELSGSSHLLSNVRNLGARDHSPVLLKTLTSLESRNDLFQSTQLARVTFLRALTMPLCQVAPTM